MFKLNGTRYRAFDVSTSRCSSFRRYNALFERILSIPPVSSSLRQVSTIFIIFINELCTLLRENCTSGTSGIFINNDIPDIVCLLLADDVTSCAETVVRLQQQLNLIDRFCRDTGMELNLNKTEIIVFRNGGNLRQNEKWFFRGNLVKITSV